MVIAVVARVRISPAGHQRRRCGAWVVGAERGAVIFLKESYPPRKCNPCNLSPSRSSTTQSLTRLRPASPRQAPVAVTLLPAPEAPPRPPTSPAPLPSPSTPCFPRKPFRLPILCAVPPSLASRTSSRGTHSPSRPPPRASAVTCSTVRPPPSTRCTALPPRSTLARKAVSPRSASQKKSSSQRKARSKPTGMASPRPVGPAP
jgi:hypothetical protein